MILELMVKLLVKGAKLIFVISVIEKIQQSVYPALNNFILIWYKNNVFNVVMKTVNNARIKVNINVKCVLTNIIWKIMIVFLNVHRVILLAMENA